MLVRSVFPRPDGVAIYETGRSDHTTPLEKRFGGWYVTSKNTSIRHMGNAVVTDPDNPESMVTDKPINLESLKGKFDTNAYLSPYSDIVALMTFDHQMRMINLLTAMNWENRVALYQERMPGILQSGSSSAQHDLAVTLRDAAKELVDYLLFIDEAPLTGKIQGTSGFTEKFQAQGPSDSKGRSLRQFDLERRLMRYPCSYMIYTEAFDGLPAEAKTAIYKRMWEILSGEEHEARYKRLSLADRTAIVEILRETKKGLPDYFRSTKQ